MMRGEWTGKRADVRLHRTAKCHRTFRYRHMAPYRCRWTPEKSISLRIQPWHLHGVTSTCNTVQGSFAFQAWHSQEIKCSKPRPLSTLFSNSYAMVPLNNQTASTTNAWNAKSIWDRDVAHGSHDIYIHNYGNSLHNTLLRFNAVAVARHSSHAGSIVRSKKRNKKKLSQCLHSTDSATAASQTDSNCTRGTMYWAEALPSSSSSPNTMGKNTNWAIASLLAWLPSVCHALKVFGVLVQESRICWHEVVFMACWVSVPTWRQYREVWTASQSFHQTGASGFSEQNSEFRGCTQLRHEL